MGHLNWLDRVAFTLMIVGGLNLGLVGLFDVNVITEIFSETLGRIIFGLVGLSALYGIYLFTKIDAGTARRTEEPEQLHRAA